MGFFFFAVVGFLGLWGRCEARRATARLTRPGAHVRRAEGGSRAVATESDAGESRGVGRAALVSSLAPRYTIPSRAGRPAPLGTSCVRGKMAALRPCCRELKMEDAAARESGAGESPTQRKRAFPS